ncbi:transcription factor S [Candidatus Woesearchaeota archaeon]|nr:transcription factor S [Candidatus Woesearchaeota archaeon]
MLFCPKCSSILKPKKTGSKTVMACSCGYTSSDTSSAKMTEAVKNNNAKVEVVEKDFQAMPLVPNKCSKCNHGKAYYWEIQTRASDEPATRFYKCEKCQHVWREYK